MGPTQAQLSELRRLLEIFLSGEDQSLAVAGRIEVGLDEAFPEDPRFEDLVHVLAFYRPGGGDYLNDAVSILPLCRAALRQLDVASKSPDGSDWEG